MTSFRFRCIGLLAALWVSWGQGEAFAQRVYWTDALNGKIQSANTDGTDVTTVFDTMTVLPEGFTHPARPAFLLVEPVAGWIYWTDLWSGVHRVKLDGTGYQNIVPITRVTIPEHTFFPNRTTTILDRADIQGIALDPVSKLLYWGPDHPLTVTPARLLWTWTRPEGARCTSAAPPVITTQPVTVSTGPSLMAQPGNSSMKALMSVTPAISRWTRRQGRCTGTAFGRERSCNKT